MPKVKPTEIDEDDEIEEVLPKKNGKSKKTVESDEEAVVGDSEEEPGEDEEYEIEEILDVKKGMFGSGKRNGYFVKWKGYPHDDNSYVDEEDAGNAEELIAEFNRKQALKKQSTAGKSTRKSLDAKSAKTSTSTRRSGVARQASSDAGDASASASAPVKKRGRPAKAKSEDVQIEEATDDKMDVDEDAPVKKKARKTPATAASSKAETSKPKSTTTKTQPAEEDAEVLEEFTDMSQYMSLASWEPLISGVDTVERNDDNTLTVYFTLTTKARVREASELCRKKFPQKLIDFYESNLRWKAAPAADGEDEAV